jgi:hypothetical protein
MSNRPQPPDTINFELTDFEEARHSLDQLPDGLIEAQRIAPDYWVPRRRAPVPSDRALTGQAMEWVMRLPPAVRPTKLCEKYPRIANAIAGVAADSNHYQAVLADLLTDQRGHRNGFCVDVRVEIERLLAVSQGRDPTPPGR